MPSNGPMITACILLDRTQYQAGAAEAQCLAEIQRCAQAGDQIGADGWDAVLTEIEAIRAVRPRPVQPLDIWRTATSLFEHMGDRAPLYASQRSKELGRTGHVAEQAVWNNILAALADLRQPGAGAN